MISASIETTLSLGEWAVSNDVDAVLTCLGLGSCVAFVAYDPVARVGGMAHVVLPDSTLGRPSPRAAAKFADLAVPLVMQEMAALGALRSRVQVSLIGGARMLAGGRVQDSLNIGERNITATRAAVQALGLHVRMEETGGGQGRTVRLPVRTGGLSISTARAFRAAA